MQYIFGFLSPANTPDLTFETRQKIYAALVRTQMSSFFSLTNWEQGKPAISKQTNIRNIERFTENLHELVTSEGIVELALQGELSIVETGKKRSEHRIVIHQGRVGVQKGAVQWETSIIPVQAAVPLSQAA